MKKLLGIVVLGLGLMFLFKYSFSIKTYLKCEAYDNNSKEILYFAFDKSHIWSYYDSTNSKWIVSQLCHRLSLNKTLKIVSGYL